MSDLTLGVYAETKHTVTDADTASRWGSGTLPVFSTPALVGLMEGAAVLALVGHLSPGQTTVGAHVDVHHLAATPVGATIHIRAELVAIEGRKLVFKIQAWDNVELIGEAGHDRFVIDETRFMAKVKAKA
jgi:fluoroacetyl-CoA thioesterase